MEEVVHGGHFLTHKPPWREKMFDLHHEVLWDAEIVAGRLCEPA